MTPRSFGEKVAASVDWKSLLSGAGKGGLAGAVLGGLHGLVAPGKEETYDDYGRAIGKKQRSRFGALVRGALGGGLLGGASGAAANYLSPGTVERIYDFGRQGYDAARRRATGKNQAQLNMADSVARLNPEQRVLHDMYMRGLERGKTMPKIPLPPPAPVPVITLAPEPWESGRQMTDAEVASSEDHLDTQ